MTTGIGTLAERSLHAGIKEWYGQEGDQFEVALDGYVIDIVRGPQLIEIQTGNFTAIKKKLHHLLTHHPVHLLYPLAAEKWIVRQGEHGKIHGRRKSPKRASWLDAFHEMVRIPHLLAHPRLQVSLLRTRQEEIWVDDGRGSWRRKRWSIGDRRLLDVLELRTFSHPRDYLTLLPDDLPNPFTNAELARKGLPPRLAQRITYTLSRCGVLVQSGKRGRAYLFSLASS